MKIDRSSIFEVTVTVSVAALLIFLLLYNMKLAWFSWSASIVLAVLALFNLFFHRVPSRPKMGDDKKVTAVADGQVVILEKVFEGEWLKKEAMKVSIYMNFFDVHANFWPVTGTVKYYRYYKGKHFMAFKPKASEENEHSCTGIVTPAGREVFFKQLAGSYARRIVCYSQEGMETVAGEQCGIIKFGSRIDLYLPVDANIKIKLGDSVTACKTVIAEL